jgi:hypothetical protein
VTWLRWLLEDLGVPVTAPTPLSSDSTGAIGINSSNRLALMLPI